MKWQLGGDWPVGQFSIPADTVLTSVSGEPPHWNGITLTMPMPINAIALDNEAAQLMLQWWGGNNSYGYDLRHRLIFGPGVDLVQRRAAIKEAAAFAAQGH
jgi:hypothetical protein